MKKLRFLAVPALAVCLIFLLTAAVWAKSGADYRLYADFLKQNEFVYKLQKKTDNGLDTYGLTFNDTYGSARYEKKSISFCLLDLNSDGVKELIVARMYSAWEPKAMQLYIFTIKGGKVRFVRYKGNDDYSIRCTGQKICYSKKFKALYCPAMEQNSDAYFDDETSSKALYTMKGTKMVRSHYADLRRKRDVSGKEEELKLYHFQSGNSSKLVELEGTPSATFREYYKSYFEDMNLKSFKLYQNNAANRKKLLGKA